MYRLWGPQRQDKISSILLLVSDTNRGGTVVRERVGGTSKRVSHSLACSDHAGER